MSAFPLSVKVAAEVFVSLLHTHKCLIENRMKIQKRLYVTNRDDRRLVEDEKAEGTMKKEERGEKKAAEVGKAVWRIDENTSTVISNKLGTTTNIARSSILKMVRDRTSPRHLFEKMYKVSLSTTEDGSKNRKGVCGPVSIRKTVT